MRNSIISILHLSDFHFSERYFREQEIVIDALVKDLHSLCVGHRRPDLIFFTGDLVHSAETDSHLRAYDEFISKVAEATNCNDDRIFIAPGNHDGAKGAAKENIDELQKWREASNNTEMLNSAYEENGFNLSSERKFKQFFELEKYLTNDLVIHRNAFASVYRIDALNVEVILFNTAVFAASGVKILGSDKGKLAIPEYCIRDAIKALSPNSYRIFSTHHPLSWLSENSAKFLRSAIQEHSHIHLFGHMHDPVSEHIVSYKGDIFSNQAGAIFSDRATYNGFSLISIDIPTKNYELHLRSYYNERSEFDCGCDILPDGKFYSSQVSREFWRDVAKPVDENRFREYLVKNCLTEAIDDPERIGLGEKSTHEIFVPPPIVKSSIHLNGDDASNATLETPIEFNQLVGGNENFILYAPPEFGRTTVLREIQYQMLSGASNIEFPRLPIVIDFSDIKSNAVSLFRIVRSRAYGKENDFEFESLIKLGHICLLVDDVIFEDTNKLNILRDFVSLYPKVRYGLSCLKGSAVPFGSQIDPEMQVRFDMLELCSLRRKDMRQLVIKMGGQNNVDMILDRLQNEIGEINLPFTAANGSILMMIYEEQSGFRPINRSVLVEQFIDVILRKTSADQSKRETFDYHNKTALLAHVAAWMALQNNYIPNYENVREEMKAYLDNFGLPANLEMLLNEFISAKLFISKPDNRLSFRYRSVLEYFIAQHMVNNSEFKDWILEKSRYLKFIHEIQFYSAKLRNDSNLVTLIGERFSEILDELKKENGGPFEFNKIASLNLPKKGSTSSLESLSKQLSNHPLSDDEIDNELEAELPRDVENRQEVFRPEIKHLGHQFLLGLLLYSGVLKNMEMIADSEKRTHLTNIWHGWGGFLLVSLKIVSDIAKYRKFKIDGVSYEISAPKKMSNEELARILLLRLPIGLTSLIMASLGTEKLERQLNEPKFDSVDQPLIFEFFRTSLIMDLRLPSIPSAVKIAFEEFRDSLYLTEAMIWKIAELRRYNRIDSNQYTKVSKSIADAITHLQGIDPKERAKEKSRQLARLKKEGLILNLKRKRQDD